MSAKFLTKSRFRVAYECPTKLYYNDRKEYENKKLDDPFLKALARGGFQVGALAKIYYPDGIEVKATDHKTAIEETNKLLEKNDVTIFESAFQFESSFIRADVLIKKGNTVHLLEVKSRTYDADEFDGFCTPASVKKGKPLIASKWEPLIMDIAFQAWVIRKARPEFRVKCSLILPDKRSVTSVDGLNQKFFLIDSDEGRQEVKVAPGTTREAVGDRILNEFSADREIEMVWNARFEDGMSFEERIAQLVKVRVEDHYPEPKTSELCKKCEFRVSPGGKGKSGFQQCWSKANGLKETDFKRPMIFDIWDMRRTKALLKDGVIFVDQVSYEDLGDDKPSGRGLSRVGRQWKQVEMVQKGETKAYLDVDGLASEMNSWQFPYHFIDFETSMVAIPFNKGFRPYSQIAFQFSHHMVHEDGRVEHKTQYINTKPGHFPNFDFVRHLKKALESDNGTIFRFADHENTVLMQIFRQLEQSHEDDRQNLMSFILSITEESGTRRYGPRTMVDLLEIVKAYYLHPRMNGSNSIKKVLPAILAESSFLQNRYSHPIYGTREITSLNFEKKVWIVRDANGDVQSPYQELEEIFTDYERDTLDLILDEDSIEDGGAAMTAYARMQFTEMSAVERERITSALLRYCELDTFAMVLIYEHWKNELKRQGLLAA